ncbi:DUF4377 domain-containing protein [Moraxella bovis]|uniref:DUF4377 domain-containing protein n=1 Tax=Moraxella bovis TaxID=476 RepID=UPI002227AE68|nr:DUF4377 domain-containing protein [Moraxella bovis]UYZ79881.1 DUF4377 domain-containing protein [Moraxella bovis]
MKKIIALSSIIALTLTGCASTQLDDTRVKTVEGEVKAVKVVNIPSFDIEIAPRKATCQLTDTAGNAVASECLQYRRTHERNYNVLSGNIEGFSFEEGNRYVLNISQIITLAPRLLVATMPSKVCHSVTKSNVAIPSQKSPLAMVLTGVKSVASIA